MDRDSIYRRVLDVCIQLNQILANIKEHYDQQQLGGCQTIKLLQERRRAALEQKYRHFEEERRRDLALNLQKSFYCDLEDRQKQIAKEH